MRKFLLPVLLMCSTLCYCQEQSTPPPPTQSKVIRKIYIKHIDPYLLWLLLNGKTTFLTPPIPKP